jgi:hypothetical protein
VIPVPILGGLFLAVFALAGVVQFVRQPGPLREGPWPGLTVTGGRLVLVCATLLAASQLLLGTAEFHVNDRSPFPWLPLAATGSTVVLVLAARLSLMPGFASGVCGAYLLARSAFTVWDSTIALPPLLLPGVMLLDLSLWLRPHHFTNVADLWPANAKTRLKRVWRKRPTPFTELDPRRAAFGGTLAGLSLGLLEPGGTQLMGGSPSNWPLELSLAAAAVCAAASGAAAWFTAAANVTLTGPLGRASEID